MILGISFVRGSGNVVTREYDVKDFKSVRLAGTGILSIDQTGEESLRVEAEENLLEYLRVEVRGSELYLGVENNVSLRPTQPIHYFVTVRSIEGISLSGMGSVHTSSLQARALDISISGKGDLDTGKLVIEDGFSLRLSGSGRMEIESFQAQESDIVITGAGKMRADAVQSRNLNLKISGSGDIRFRNAVVESMETRISGSGDIELEGKTNSQNLTISAAGKYRAQNFESERAKVKISGSGKAWVSVKERLDVRISGIGTVHYLGRPVLVQSISGAGKVKYIE